MFMQPVVIDVVGTVRRFVFWALLQIVYFFALIAFALLAPLIFTVGAEYLAWKYPQYASTWAVVYLFLGPLACTVWMSPISHWQDWVADYRARRAGKRPARTHSFVYGTVRGLGYMFAGFCGSVLAEAALTIAAHKYGIIPHHLILFFAVAPFAVFAPCWLVVLRRWIRKDRYATA
jgi:hypothetical protein